MDYHIFTMDEAEVLCSGKLEKRSDSGPFSSWKSRWFVCTSKALLYFDKEADWKAGKAEHGNFALHNLVLESASEASQIQIKLKHSSRSSLTLRAATASEARKWKDEIERARNPPAPRIADASLPTPPQPPPILTPPEDPVSSRPEAEIKPTSTVSPSAKRRSISEARLISSNANDSGYRIEILSQKLGIRVREEGNETLIVSSDHPEIGVGDVVVAVNATKLQSYTQLEQMAAIAPRPIQLDLRKSSSPGSMSSGEQGKVEVQDGMPKKESGSPGSGEEKKAEVQDEMPKQLLQRHEPGVDDRVGEQPSNSRPRIPLDILWLLEDEVDELDGTHSSKIARSLTTKWQASKR